jgi:hypothetical protein
MSFEELSPTPAISLVPQFSVDPSASGFYTVPLSATLQGSENGMDAGQWRRCVRLSVTEGALATAMFTLVSGVFLTGFAISLGASRITIGLLMAIPSLANVAQLWGAAWLRAGMNRKRLCVGALAASRVLWLTLIVVPLLGLASDDWLVRGLVMIVAMSSVLAALGGVAWLSWIRDLVPARKQLGFLGLRNQFDTILALALSAGGAVFLDWWQAESPNSRGGFVTVLLAAVVCGLIGIPILNRIEDPVGTPPATPLGAPNARRPLRERNFRRLVSFYLCWNLFANLATPFFAVFMLEKLGLRFWQIIALQALSSVTGLIANRWWTALGRRWGTRPVVFLATLGDAFYPLCWLFLTPETAWALPLVFLFGAFNTPLAVGGPALAMRLASDDDAPRYLATFNTIMGVVMGIAAIAGGCLASSSFHLASAPWSDGLRLVFLISSLGRFGSLFFLGQVVDAGSTPISSLLLRKPRWLSVLFAGRAGGARTAAAPLESAAVAQAGVSVE